MKKSRGEMKFVIKHTTLIILLLNTILAGATITGPVNDYVLKRNNHTVVFLNAENAYNYSIKSEFFCKWNAYFDASIRLKKDLSAYSKSENLMMYKSYLKNQCLNWRENEIEDVTRVIHDAQERIHSWSKKVLQDTLFLIKTTGKEEFGSYYTNQKAIVIPKKALKFMAFKAGKRQMEEILIHELFHIYSRYNVPEREKLYSMIGFKRLDTLFIPDELEQKRITNPDFYDLKYAITLEDSIKGVKKDYIMLLVSKYPKYDGVKNFIGLFSSLFGYLEVQFHSIDKNGNVEIAQTDLGKDIYDKTGMLSDYSLGVDEILAEAFRVFIMMNSEDKNQSSKRDEEIVQKLKAIMESQNLGSN
jgi:hypothetical protein